jgi:hypothetical protein
LTTNCGKKTVKRKWEKQNIFKYNTWNVRGIAHKEEELDSVFNEKQIKISAITESKTKLKVTIITILL